MTYDLDSALRRPPAGSPRELLAFLEGTERPEVAPTAISATVAGGMGFVLVDSVAAFWEERGDDSLGAATAELLAAVWRMTRTMVVAIGRSGGSLVYAIGIERMTGRQTAQVVTSVLPGAEVSALEGLTGSRAGAAREVIATREHAWALVGVPRVDPVPPGVPLPERLAESRFDDWSLWVRATPLSLGQHLIATARDVEACLDRIAEAATTSVRISEERTVAQPARWLDRLLVLLESERERSSRALREGGFTVEAWLSAAEPLAAASLAGIVASRLAPDDSVARPFRVVPHSAGGRPGACLMVPAEIAALATPPSHDVRGLPVRSWSRFDEHPEVPAAAAADMLALGATPAGSPVPYPRDRLVAHGLVTGITGSGKTTFVRSLLQQLGSAGVPFLVIEPAKSEYGGDGLPGLRKWIMGDPASTDEWRLNPLEVPDGIPAQTHIDLLMALLASTLGLHPPLPYVIEMGLREVYAEHGWDIGADANAFGLAQDAPGVFPLLRDLTGACAVVVERLGYSGEVRANVDAALQARLGGLVAGARGRALDTDERFPIDDLLSRPTLVNLDLVGNEHEKAFLIGLLLIRVWEARRGEQAHGLRHLIVLEEAHRVFANQPVPPSGEGLPRHDFAAETLANMLAEVRSAGQGLLIVDQSPRKLAPDALANTALKVAFRATAREDKEAIAAVANLDEAQQRAMTGLPAHRAVVFWEGMDRPVLMDAARSFQSVSPTPYVRPSSASGAIVEDDRANRLADALVHASTLRERSNGHDYLRRRLAVLLHGTPAASLPGPQVDALVERSIERLGRRRRWSRAVRDACSRAALAPRDAAGDALLRHFRRTPQPFEACAHACALGGCTARELVEEPARRLRMDRAKLRLVIPQVHGSDLSRLLGHTVDAAMGGASLPETAATAARCLTVQWLDGQVPLSLIHEALDNVELDGS